MGILAPELFEIEIPDNLFNLFIPPPLLSALDLLIDTDFGNESIDVEPVAPLDIEIPEGSLGTDFDSL